MAPEADASDGLLDLCIAGTPRRLAMLGLIVRYLSGSQAGHPHITTGRTGTRRVRAEGAAIAVHAAGETVSVEHSELEVRCVAATLEIVRPSAPDPARA